MLYIKVPATTANFGCGFDSIGMSLKIYNKLWIEEASGSTEIKILNANEHLHSVPTNESNLIYRTIRDFYRHFDKAPPNIRMLQKDKIPMTRGLGSSAACIVAGILAANELSGERMPLDWLTQYATKIEGHPDNVAPALLGGIVIGAMSGVSGDRELKYVRIDAPDDLRFAVMVPAFSISTEKARKVLPRFIPHKDGVFNAQRAGLLVASLLTGHYENLNVALDDRLHQPYRRSLVPEMEGIFKKTKEYGAKGVFLSGAGPTVLAVLLNDSNAESFANNMEGYLKSVKGGWEIRIVDADTDGACVTETDACDDDI